MRIAYLLNKDKSVHLFAITGDILPAAAVKLTFDKTGPTVLCCSNLLWAMDEQGKTIVAISDILNDVPAADRSNPLKVLAAIDAAKGKQVCLDAAGVLRCVDTMRDNEATFGAKDLPELSAGIDIQDDEAKMLADATATIKRKAGAMFADDGTNADLFERLTLWRKAGCKVVKLSDGKKPVYLTAAELFKQ